MSVNTVMRASNTNRGNEISGKELPMSKIIVPDSKIKGDDDDHAGAEMIAGSLIMYPLWRRHGDLWYPDVPTCDRPVLVIPALHIEELLAERVVLHPAGEGLGIADEAVANDLLTHAARRLGTLWSRVDR
jgi:hypothetical protein